MSIRRNSLYNLAGAVLPLAVALLTVPLYIRLIGQERFGVLSIGWLMLGYFGLFDLGLGRAIAQKLASLKAAPPSERAEVFWTAFALNTGLGVLAALLLWPAATLFFGDYFKISDALRIEMLDAVPWLVSTLPVAMVSGVLSGALQGREQFLAVNVAGTIGTVLTQTVPLVTASTLGPHVSGLIASALIARTGTLLLLYASCRVYIPLGARLRFNPAHLRPLLGYGGWVTVTAVVGPLLTAFDRLVIGITEGAKSVTLYVVPFDLVKQVGILPNSVSNALFPRFVSMVAHLEQRANLTDEAVRSLLVIMTPIIVVGLIAVGPFLELWLGSGFSKEAATIAQTLLLGFWINSLAKVPYALLQAQGRPDLVAKCHAAELLPYALGLVVALKSFGVTGAAIAWTVRVTLDTALLFWLSGYRLWQRHLLLYPTVLVGSGMIAAMLDEQTAEKWPLATVVIVLAMAWAWKFAPSAVRGPLLAVWARFR